MSHRIPRPDTAFSLDPRGQRRPRQKAEAHLKWIRTLPSLVSGIEPVQAAHIRFSDHRYAKRQVGIGEKPDDKFVVPLAGDAHRAQHATNERQWWIDKGIDPVAVALCLWAHTGDDEAAQIIIRNAKQIGRVQ